jgi:two-component system, NtrC family, response regulator AtoC
LPPAEGGALRDQVRFFEASLIARTLDEVKGDRRAAAERLSIGLSSLYRKIDEYADLGLIK